MLYTIFIRKIKGNHRPFAISVAFNSYFKKFGDNNDIVIAFPGYMSKTTSNINNFISSINFPTHTYFTVGMNGNQFAKPSCANSIQYEHNINKKFHFTVTGLKNTNEDHAKMIFVLNNPKGLNCVKASDLITFDVKAVLIGSSNQSYITYFNKIADKGEADLFLINGNYLKADNNSTSQDDQILQLFNIIKFQEFEEIKAKKNDEIILNHIALFKEFNQDTTLNLNKLFKETIINILE